MGIIYTKYHKAKLQRGHSNTDNFQGGAVSSLNSQKCLGWGQCWTLKHAGEGAVSPNAKLEEGHYLHKISQGAVTQILTILSRGRFIYLEL